MVLRTAVRNDEVLEAGAPEGTGQEGVARRRRRRARPSGSRRRSAAVAVGLVAVVCAAQAATSSYTLRRGDTLSEVAQRFSTSVRSLVSANGIADPDEVRAGTRLRVPEPSADRSGATSAGRAGANANAGGAGGTSGARTAGSDNLPARLRDNPERLALTPSFDRWAREYGVPADLLKAVAWLESGWQSSAVSSVGARGIGQLTPDTSDFVSGQLLQTPLDPRRSDDNIRMSARYLRWLLDRTGSTDLALASYFQGPESVRRDGVGASSRDYIDKVNQLRRRF